MRDHVVAPALLDWRGPLNARLSLRQWQAIARHLRRLGELEAAEIVAAGNPFRYH